MTPLYCWYGLQFTQLSLKDIGLERCPKVLNSDVTFVTEQLDLAHTFDKSTNITEETQENSTGSEQKPQKVTWPDSVAVFFLDSFIDLNYRQFIIKINEK